MFDIDRLYCGVPPDIQPFFGSIDPANTGGTSLLAATTMRRFEITSIHVTYAGNLGASGASFTLGLGGASLPGVWQKHLLYYNAPGPPSGRSMTLRTSIVMLEGDQLWGGQYYDGLTAAGCQLLDFTISGRSFQL